MAKKFVMVATALPTVKEQPMKDSVSGFTLDFTDNQGNSITITMGKTFGLAVRNQINNAVEKNPKNFGYRT